MSGNEERPPMNQKPWYREPWLWFLIALILSSVGAGTTMVIIAMKNPDTVVRDDWYRDGRAIHRSLERDAEARRLGLVGELTVDELTGELFFELKGAGTERLERLEIELLHPTLEKLDQTVVLRRAGPGIRFRGDLDRFIAGRWLAAVIPLGEMEESQRWRLKKRISLPASDPIRFDPKE